MRGTLIKKDDDDPILFGPSQLISSSKLSKNLGDYLNRAQKRPLFVTRGGEPEAVLVSIDQYRELLREETLVEDLYHSVLGLRRLLETIRNETEMMDFKDVLTKYGLTEADLIEDDEDGGVED